MFLAYNDCIPRVGADVYVADAAQVIGNVALGDGVTVLPGAVVRAEDDPIYVGAGSVVEDAAVLHADSGGLELGERVVVGHGAIVHGARVGSNTLIGMGATVLKDSVIGEGCLIAAGALVTEGAQIPPRSVVMGVPGRVVREAGEEDAAYIASAASYYAAWGVSCRAGALHPVEPRSL